MRGSTNPTVRRGSVVFCGGLLIALTLAACGGGSNTDDGVKVVTKNAPDLAQELKAAIEGTTAATPATDDLAEQASKTSTCRWLDQFTSEPAGAAVDGLQEYAEVQAVTDGTTLATEDPATVSQLESITGQIGDAQDGAEVYSLLNC